MTEFQILPFKKNQKLYRDFLKKWCSEVFDCLLKEKIKNKKKLKSLELSLVFVSKHKIKKINSQYRGKNQETDVLSFEGDGAFSLGELILCMEVIQKKAQKADLPEKLYLCLLVTHGLLHLLGYEHEADKKKELEMFALQNKIMRKVAEKLAPEYKKDFDISI